MNHERSADIKKKIKNLLTTAKKFDIIKVQKVRKVKNEKIKKEKIKKVLTKQKTYGIIKT